jgi:glycerol-3-phosphate dehydrogenase
VKKIGVIGAGKWGQALAFAFRQNPENEVYITSRTKREMNTLSTTDKKFWS